VTDHAVYVYGVAPAGVAVPLDTQGIDPGSALETVESGELVALVSGVDEAALERRVEDAAGGELAAVEPLLRAHERVLSRAQEAGAILPFRFGIVVRNHDDVRRLLDERGADLRAQLDRLQDAREWGVKGLVARDALEAFVTRQSPVLDELAREAAEGTGSAFFARKRLEQKLDSLLREAAADVAATAHDRIAACARDAAMNPPQPRELSGYADEMILNGAYLVERRCERALAAAVSELEAEFADRGLHLELTGPWPPFNFVDVSAASASAG
jgi:hypothetical protein